MKEAFFDQLRCAEREQCETQRSVATADRHAIKYTHEVTHATALHQRSSS
jgi:hypothetical protein